MLKCRVSFDETDPLARLYLVLRGESVPISRTRQTVSFDIHLSFDCFHPLEPTSFFRFTRIHSKLALQVDIIFFQVFKIRAEFLISSFTERSPI